MATKTQSGGERRCSLQANRQQRLRLESNWNLIMTMACFAITDPQYWASTTSSMSSLSIACQIVLGNIRYPPAFHHQQHGPLRVDQHLEPLPFAPPLLWTGTKCSPCSARTSSPSLRHIPSVLAPRSLNRIRRDGFTKSGRLFIEIISPGAAPKGREMAL